jgi:hypothetical protein
VIRFAKYFLFLLFLALPALAGERRAEAGGVSSDDPNLNRFVASSGLEEESLADGTGLKDRSALREGDDLPLPVNQLVVLVIGTVAVSYAMPFIFREYKRHIRRSARQRQKAVLLAPAPRQPAAPIFATPTRRSAGQTSATRSPVFLRESRHHGHGEVIGFHEALTNQATQRLL